MDGIVLHPMNIIEIICMIKILITNVMNGMDTIRKIIIIIIIACCPYDFAYIHKICMYIPDTYKTTRIMLTPPPPTPHTASPLVYYLLYVAY